MTQMSELRNQLTKFAAQAHLISLAATGLNHIGAIGDGDMQGIIDLADRIERELSELADEVHPRRARSTAGLADRPFSASASGRRPFLFRRLDRLFLFKFLCDFDQGSRLVELRSQPDPSHLQGKELIAGFWRAASRASSAQRSAC